MNQAKGGKIVNATKATKSLTLTCRVSGKSRPTTQEYLDNKASRLGVTVEEIVNSYVTREVLKNLRKGDLQGLSKSDADNIIRLNGKHAALQTA